MEDAGRWLAEPVLPLGPVHLERLLLGDSVSGGLELRPVTARFPSPRGIRAFRRSCGAARLIISEHHKALPSSGSLGNIHNLLKSIK